MTTVGTEARAGTTAVTAARAATTEARALMTARAPTEARALMTARVRIAPRYRMSTEPTAPQAPMTVRARTGPTVARAATGPTVARAGTIDRRVGPEPLPTCRPRRPPRSRRLVARLRLNELSSRLPRRLRKPWPPVSASSRR